MLWGCATTPEKEGVLVRPLGSVLAEYAVWGCGWSAGLSEAVVQGKEWRDAF